MRAKPGPKPIPPVPESIRAARAAAGHTQTQAARVIYSTLRTWQKWEGGERRMHPALFELYVLKVSSPS